MNDADDDANSSSSPAFLSPQRAETREALLERLLRELVWRSDNVRTILLRDREKTDFDHAADLLDTHHIHDVLKLKSKESEE